MQNLVMTSSADNINNANSVSQLPVPSSFNIRAPVISPKSAAHMGYGELRLELIQGRNIFFPDHCTYHLLPGFLRFVLKFSASTS